MSYVKIIEIFSIMEPFFNPRVGQFYEKESIKILILGESHYCSEAGIRESCNMCKENHKCHNWTINGLDEIITRKNYNRSHNTYIKFEKSLSGKECFESIQERWDFWDKYIMYNYVQNALSKARKSPTKSEFYNSQKSFFYILEKYKPQLVIVWGKRLWNNLPKELRICSSLYSKQTNVKEYNYVNGGKVYFTYIYHPSCQRFKWKEWAKYLALFISKYGVV